MIKDEIQKYLQIVNKRVFIDIAKSGCGSGCAYCFINNPLEEQKLLSFKEIKALCNAVDQLKMKSGFVISLCPNTEPLKSKESREHISYIVDYFSKKEANIQISTKEKISTEYLEKLNNYAKFQGQIRISISLPYLHSSRLIEPNAAAVADRIDNFKNINDLKGLCSTLYLRPFNKEMLKEKEKYVTIINDYKPQNICLGAEFVKRVDFDQKCTLLYDEKLSKAFASVDLPEIIDFANYIRKQTKCKVFHSSVCNIANSRDYGCVHKLYNFNKELCIDCEIMDIVKS